MSLYSKLLKRAQVFPQVIMENRVVMCSAIAKQCCKLGRGGEFNQPQLIRATDCEGIPELEGRNVLLGIMDWNLFNHEDACIISEDLAMKLTTYRDITSTFVDAGENTRLAIKEGDKVHAHAIVGLFTDDSTMVLQNKVAGIVKEIHAFDHEIEGRKVKCTRVTVESEYVCRVGSKLSNLHSCKSIISRILPIDRMPTMANGKPIEMMISPMSIGNRVNPSLILEGMLGMYARHKGMQMEMDPFINEMEYNGKTYSLFEWASKLLETIGIPGDCEFTLKNGTNGKKFDYRTFVGYVFLMRLHHHADEKLLYQNKLMRDQSGLTVMGAGNTRYGREEAEILYQHQAHGVLNEMIANSKKSTIGKQISGLVKTLGFEYVQ